MMELVSQSIEILKQVYHPQGFNVGINQGEAAGAGIREHVHIHVVPRWGGDTNFMSALAETRVLPESLEDTYQRVQAAWHTIFASGTNQQERSDDLKPS
jgi:ATP adenylyltransferase